MEVITIESKAYRELAAKLDTIAKFVAENRPDDKKNPDEEWVDSYDVCTFLKISERTLQRLRSSGCAPAAKSPIPFSRANPITPSAKSGGCSNRNVSAVRTSIWKS